MNDLQNDGQDQGQDDGQDGQPAGNGQAGEWSNVDPSKIPHDVVAQTPAFAGLMEEVRTLRANNQQTQQMLLQMQQGQGQAKPQENEAEQALLKKIQDDPDALLTARENMLLFEMREKKREQKQQTEKQASQVQRENASMERLRQKFPKGGRNVPQGLDADTVITTGVAYLAQKFPGLLQDLRQQEDVAQAIYDTAVKLVPDLAQRSTSVANESFIDRLGRPAVGGQSSPSSSSDYSDILSLISQPAGKLQGALEQADLNALR